MGDSPTHDGNVVDAQDCGCHCLEEHGRKWSIACSSHTINVQSSVMNMPPRRALGLARNFENIPQPHHLPSTVSSSSSSNRETAVSTPQTSPENAVENPFISENSRPVARDRTLDWTTLPENADAAPNAQRASTKLTTASTQQKLAQSDETSNDNASLSSHTGAARHVSFSNVVVTRVSSTPPQARWMSSEHLSARLRSEDTLNAAEAGSRPDMSESGSGTQVVRSPSPGTTGEDAIDNAQFVRPAVSPRSVRDGEEVDLLDNADRARPIVRSVTLRSTTCDVDDAVSVDGLELRSPITLNTDVTIIRLPISASTQTTEEISGAAPIARPALPRSTLVNEDNGTNMATLTRSSSQSANDVSPVARLASPKALRVDSGDFEPTAGPASPNTVSSIGNNPGPLITPTSPSPTENDNRAAFFLVNARSDLVKRIKTPPIAERGSLTSTPANLQTAVPSADSAANSIPPYENDTSTLARYSSTAPSQAGESSTGMSSSPPSRPRSPTSFVYTDVIEPAELPGSGGDLGDPGPSKVPWWKPTGSPHPLRQVRRLSDGISSPERTNVRQIHNSSR